MVGYKTFSLTAVGVFALPAILGCSCTNEKTTKAEFRSPDRVATVSYTETERRPALDDAKVGECFAEVFLPPVTRTETERVCVRDAYERAEIVPARYEWVEEKVCVKDAGTTLVQEPATFKTEQRVVEVQNGHTSWVVKTEADCRAEDGTRITATTPMFCYVNVPPLTKVVVAQTVDKAVNVREVVEPAEYQIVKRNKLVQAAMVKKVSVPAEYEDVSRTVVITPGRVEMRRVVCELIANPAAVIRVKDALVAQGYDAGPRDGRANEPFWAAIRQYQHDSGIGVGPLTSETLEHLKIDVSRL